MRIILFAVMLCLVGCLPTTSGYVSNFNDGHDSWRHQNWDTELSRDVSGEATQMTLYGEMASHGVGMAAGFFGDMLASPVPIGWAARPLGKFVTAELLTSPPPMMPLVNKRLPADATTDEVHGIILRLNFQWDWPWMQDHRQSEADRKGKRDLAFRVRSYSNWRNIALTQDKNDVYGWVEVLPFPWPRGHPLEISVYDRDVVFDDGMCKFEVPDVNFYYNLYVEADDKRYHVGKIGFLSESDMALMREHYADLQVSPGAGN